MKQTSHTRIQIISGFTLLLALLLVARLYSIQIVSGARFATRAEHQYLNNNYSLFERGTIFFTNRDGTAVPAATLKSGFTVALNPQQVRDPQDAFKKLSGILALDKASFVQKASKKDDPYEEIARRVDAAKSGQIEALGLKGVNTFREKWRFYPGGEMGSHILGFVGYKGDEFGGRTGLERYYEDVLRRSGEGEYVNFFAEIFSNIKDELSSNEQREGDIVTTIEPAVQAFLERELRNVNEKYDSEYTGAIVMDPRTGEIVAMAIDPSYDPNDLKEVKPAILTNKLVENVYEMGSIIKPLTMAAGIDSGAVTPSTTYNDTGSIWLNNRKISNYDGKARGVVPMQQVLSQSLNLGTTFIEQRMGRKEFAKYMLGYGIGEKTGIDLPNETEGIVSNLKSPRDVEYATASFGQGIAMTPIETTRALATLANGGLLVRPHLVKEIRYRNGTSKAVEEAEPKRVLKKETTEEVSRMLVEVVDTALRGGTVKLPNYTVAAKTGTAQIALESGRGYYEDRYLHSFFGYFPAYDPKFLVFMYTVYPKNVKYASETLTESVMDMAKFLINYYEIPPDR